ncbi:MAG: hypothetical protein AB1743_00495 [Actinomycetota bacterium]
MAQGNLAGKIASLEMQIKLLKGQAKKKKKEKGLSKLYGSLKGKSETSFEEIKAVELKISKEVT